MLTIIAGVNAHPELESATSQTDLAKPHSHQHGLNPHFEAEKVNSKTRDTT
jgi:hypothetical protein